MFHCYVSLLEGISAICGECNWGRTRQNRLGSFELSIAKARYDLSSTGPKMNEYCACHETFICAKFVCIDYYICMYIIYIFIYTQYLYHSYIMYMYIYIWFLPSTLSSSLPACLWFQSHHVTPSHNITPSSVTGAGEWLGTFDCRVVAELRVCSRCFVWF